MIGARHGEAIRALQAETAMQGAQSTALSLRIDALSAALAAECERAADRTTKITDLERRAAEAEQIITSQADTLRVQAELLDVQLAQIRLLQERDDRQDELIGQMRGAIVRIERQAAIDLDEMRRTGTALARTVLLRQAGAALLSE